MSLSALRRVTRLEKKTKAILGPDGEVPIIDVVYEGFDLANCDCHTETAQGYGRYAPIIRTWLPREQ